MGVPRPIYIGHKLELLCSIICSQQEPAPPTSCVTFWNQLSRLDCKPKIKGLIPVSWSKKLPQEITGAYEGFVWTLSMLIKNEFVSQENDSISTLGQDSQKASFYFVLLSSYLKSRLLLSGDVEQNPGPGKRAPSSSVRSTIEDESTYDIIPAPVITSDNVDINLPQQSLSPGRRSMPCSLSPTPNSSPYKSLCVSLTPSLTHLPYTVTHDANLSHPEQSLKEEGDTSLREGERIIQLESENATLIEENKRLKSEVEQLKQQLATDHEYPDLSACSDCS